MCCTLVVDVLNDQRSAMSKPIARLLLIVGFLSIGAWITALEGTLDTSPRDASKLKSTLVGGDAEIPEIKIPSLITLNSTKIKKAPVQTGPVDESRNSDKIERRQLSASCDCWTNLKESFGYWTDAPSSWVRYEDHVTKARLGRCTSEFSPHEFVSTSQGCETMEGFLDQLQRLNIRRMLLIGDSMTEQHYDMLKAELKISFPESTVALDVVKIYGFFDMNMVLQKARRAAETNNVIVVNIGMHYHEWKGGPLTEKEGNSKRRSDLETDLRYLLTNLQEIQASVPESKSYLILRESLPQHFPAEDGSGDYDHWGQRQSQTPGLSCVNTVEVGRSWRTDVMDNIAKELCIPVIKLYDLFENRPYFYRQGKSKNDRRVDCTHLCPFKSVFRPWNLGICHVLKGFSKCNA